MSDDFDGTNIDVYNRIRSRLNHLIGRIKRISNNESEEISGFRGDNLIIVTSVEYDIEETMETHKQQDLNYSLHPQLQMVNHIHYTNGH